MPDSSLFSFQLDYVFFLYGLGFVLLSAVLYYILRLTADWSFWSHLFLFALLHGIHEWLEMVNLVIGQPYFSWLRMALLLISFACLFEFGRRNLKKQYPRVMSLWAYLPFLGLMAFLNRSDIQHFDASVRYCFALPGAILAALVLREEEKKRASGALRNTSLAMFIYGLVTGLIVPPTDFFPASLFNTTAFEDSLGIPVQILGGGLAVFMASSVWTFYLSEIALQLSREKEIQEGFFARNRILFTAVFLMIVGAFATHFVGKIGEVRDTTQHNYQVALLKSSFSPPIENVNRLVRLLARSLSPGLFSRNQEAISEVLDQTCSVFERSICYAIDPTGKIINSSNRGTSQSLVGVSASERPYFKSSLHGQQGQYFGTSIVTGLPEYFTAFPIQDPSRQLIGVAAIQLSMETIRSFGSSSDAVMVVDETKGVVLQSNHPSVNWRWLWPPSESTRSAIRASNQYPLDRLDQYPPLFPRKPGQDGWLRLDNRIYHVFQTPSSLREIEFLILGAEKWRSIYRLGAILAVLLLTLMSITFLIIIQNQKESAWKLESVQSQLAHSAKLASIGTLAAGVAHEINNPLTISNGFINILREGLEESNALTQEQAAYFEKIALAHHRIGTIVKGLRTYARADTDIIECVDVHKAIADSVSMVQTIFEKSGIRIACDLRHPRPVVMANMGKLQQILMNLLSNAADSMQNPGSVKLIQIETKAENKFVACSVSDHGCGIHPKHRSRLFEPFFTTKPPGEGTGLGLALVYSIVESFQGSIQVRSELGEGSTFLIRLPMAPEEIQKDDTEALPETADLAASRRFDARILLVDDEDDIRTVAKRMLLKQGLTVEEAVDGLGALEMLSSKSFDIVLTDLKMPNMSGIELIQRGRTLAPQTKFVAFTGGIITDYSAEERRVIRESAHGYLTKPFEANELIKMLRTVLEKA